MEAFENLISRRSIRKFKKKSIPETLIKKILKAGMYAPSAKNSRPWEFMIVDEPDLLEKISTLSPNIFMAKDAAFGILICGDHDRDYKGFWPQDCAASTQNILLAAHALGLGAVWTGIYPKEDLIKAYEKIFNFPENITPFCFIPIGYPQEEKTNPQRFDESRLHRNQW